MIVLSIGFECLSSRMVNLRAATSEIIPVIAFIMLLASIPFIAFGVYYLRKAAADPKSSGMKALAVISVILGGIVLLGTVAGLVIVFITPPVLNSLYGANGC